MVYVKHDSLNLQKKFPAWDSKPASIDDFFFIAVDLYRFLLCLSGDIVYFYAYCLSLKVWFWFVHAYFWYPCFNKKNYNVQSWTRKSIIELLLWMLQSVSLPVILWVWLEYNLNKQLLPLFQIIRRFGFSWYIDFTMYLDIV